jgi:hypothetical protein
MVKSAENGGTANYVIGRNTVSMSALRRGADVMLQGFLAQDSCVALSG